MQNFKMFISSHLTLDYLNKYYVAKFNIIGHYISFISEVDVTLGFLLLLLDIRNTSSSVLSEYRKTSFLNGEWQRKKKWYLVKG